MFEYVEWITIGKIIHFSAIVVWSVSVFINNCVGIVHQNMYRQKVLVFIHWGESPIFHAIFGLVCGRVPASRYHKQLINFENILVCGRTKLHWLRAQMLTRGGERCEMVFNTLLCFMVGRGRGSRGSKTAGSFLLPIGDASHRRNHFKDTLCRTILELVWSYYGLFWNYFGAILVRWSSRDAILGYFEIFWGCCGLF